MAKKKSLIAMIEEAIAKGATTAEDIHKAIADKPLKMLLKVDALSGPAKKIKRIQDESIGAIYDLIREINELVAKYATEMLAQAREGDLRKSATSMRKSMGAAVKRAKKAGAAAKRQVTAAVKRAPKAAAAKKKPAKAAAKRTVKKAPAAKKKAAGAKKRAVKASPAPAA
jgi:colicin import membrane protein